MKSFFKIFFATLLALFIFSLISFFITMGVIAGLASSGKEATGNKAVLVLDLSQPFAEISEPNPLTGIGNRPQYDVPSLYDAVRMIRHAKADSAVKGIYIKCAGNANSFGASEAIRNALLDFQSTKKFVLAYGEVISQGGYRVANLADELYCHPKGGVDWRGYAFQNVFLKGALEKLAIEPQIFYAGKFKSATEPFRETQMTAANKEQMTVLMNDLYAGLLEQTAAARELDTATLHRYADQNLIRSASDALQYKLVDGLKYDDEVQDILRTKLGLGKTAKINFVSLGKYAQAVNFKRQGSGRIALIYAEGDIVDGKGGEGMIGSDPYRQLIRKARFDDDVKAIVLRINSGGGSAMASENIWRELTLARKDKPVVVSFGDVSASGGYYLSCNADSIFAEPGTITGSIGVFTLLPNMQQFFNKKLGITFDGVKTSPDADMMSVSKPLTEMQKRFVQAEIDSIYHTFLSRVAEGRKLTLAQVDSIGQGRVWTGSRALQLGLVDRIGGLDAAVDCAAGMAKLSEYRLREYPEPRNFMDRLLGSYQEEAAETALQRELGTEGLKTFRSLQRLKASLGVHQARLPFELEVLP
ncbi:MAG: signal peptide peptidase SppA [Candidatus Pseudobacter hemicellulosilyticus]|uniref:Signal peptide peptidase SppA n=1 Tax=Candidatus Pseudobacter hemicellulosilyticus TaxID=3121375 RepID=A0AAJ6BJQ0_9BACT|nr:MAG: signal peptide peptidase SppA [Pseudobacter sp.]